MLTKDEWLRVLAAVAGLVGAVLAAAYFASVMGVRVGEVISASVWVYLVFLCIDLVFSAVERWGGPEKRVLPRAVMVAFAMTAAVGAAGRDALKLAGMPQAEHVVGVVMLAAMLGLVGASLLENRTRPPGG